VIFGNLKRDATMDEVLVPTNFACENGRCLRDVELAYLIQEMNEKGLATAVVLDCCHSGGATRGQAKQNCAHC